MTEVEFTCVGILIWDYLLYHGYVNPFQSTGSRNQRRLCSGPAQLRLNPAHPIYATARSISESPIFNEGALQAPCLCS
jgi:hypothetical protein